MKKICFFLLAICLIGAACKKNKLEDEGNGEFPVWTSCEDKKILKILENEPAIVRKQCFEHVERVDTFFFELVNQYSEFFSIGGIFPVGEIPQQYRKEGLSVYIGGNVTSCTVLGGCSEPDIKLAAIPLFESKSIKANE